MREAATVFFGLGAHLGSARSQNGKGHVLGHVQDLGLASNDPNVPHLPDARRQTFHTTLATSSACFASDRRSGGLSALVSLDDDLQRDAPAAARSAKRLFQPVATDRRGEVPEGQKPYFRIPTFSWPKAS